MTDFHSLRKLSFFIWPIFLSLFFSRAAFSQEEIKLSNIQKPGDTGIAAKPGIVLAENFLGPCKVTFSGNSPGHSVPALSKEEAGPSGGRGSFDKLAVLYSGRVYSPNLAEPVLFENKTPEELALLEIPVFPTILEQPYTLLLDLTIRAASKPIPGALSDDAGVYAAYLNVILIKI
jgi:hypothetical protein